MAGPAFYQTPRKDTLSFATANTNLDGSGTLGSLSTGASGGSVITQIVFQAIVTVTDGRILIVTYDGTNHRLYDVIQVKATTLSSQFVKPWRHAYNCHIELPTTSDVLKVGTYNAETFHATAFGFNKS